MAIASFVQLPNGQNAKTFRSLDGNQNAVEVQGICLVDENGHGYAALSEATGRALLKELRRMNDLLERRV